LRCKDKVPTILRIGHLRVVIYLNDHRSEHVHVKTPEHEAVFHLNSPTGPVSLRQNEGLSSRELKRIARVLDQHITDLCAKCKEIHASH
jgi:Domain of unknown function (DUF4160)